MCVGSANRCRRSGTDLHHGMGLECDSILQNNEVVVGGGGVQRSLGAGSYLSACHISGMLISLLLPAAPGTIL